MIFRKWIVLSLGTVFLFLLSALPADAKKRDAPSQEDARPSADLYEKLQLFSRALEFVRKDYVEKPKEKELMYGAIRGMVSALDPYSIFMPQEFYRQLKVDTEGRFGGIGTEVTIKDHFLTVVAPMEGSPAAKIGIRPGDRILKINGTSTKDMDLGEAVRLMRGNLGTKITLTLVHEGSREPFEVTLTRETIHIKSVRSEIPEPGYGYLRINSFQEETGLEVRRALRELSKKSKGVLRGLILDLRNNPGGLLDEAVSVSDAFLKSGIIVTTSSRNQVIDKKVATSDGAEPSYPVVVMINGGSASAAEIVAGALQDNNRAVLLGTKSFGKGSVQTIFELGDGSALKLTVAQYYTPKGRSIQAKGIVPDVLVEPSQKEENKEKGKEEDYQKKAALDYLKELGSM